MKVKRFSFTVDNHLDEYCIPTRTKTIDWIVELEDGTVEKGCEE